MIDRIVENRQGFCVSIKRGHTVTQVAVGFCILGVNINQFFISTALRSTFLVASLEHPRNERRQNGSIGVLIFGCKVHPLREACCTYAWQTPDQTGF